MKPVPDNHPLQRLFKGLVENAFYAELGMCEPDLAEYIADLLVKFAHVDVLYALRNAEGQRLDQIADMLTTLTCGNDGVRGEEELLVHRHVGDFTLFWSGLYPEHLAPRRPGWTHKNRLRDYVAQGKRSYAIASRLADSATSPPSSSLLERLSDNFDSCRQGLELVRRGWSRTGGPDYNQATKLLF